MLDLVLNFKFLTLLFLILTCSSCGVKGPPKAPKGTEVPSFVSPYLKDKEKTKAKESKKQDSDQQEVTD